MILLQVRVSAVLTNAPYFLNLDCDHYINNSKALREAMCFMMDPTVGRKVCYVQFPQRFDGIDANDRYANRNTVFFDVSLLNVIGFLLLNEYLFWFKAILFVKLLILFQINMKGLDGIQGPMYVGTGCVFRRQALYGYEPPAQPKKKSTEYDCLLGWCGGSRPDKAKSKKAKQLEKKKPPPARSDSSVPMFNLEDIEEGLEGKSFNDMAMF